MFNVEGFRLALNSKALVNDLQEPLNLKTLNFQH